MLLAMLGVVEPRDAKVPGRFTGEVFARISCGSTSMVTYRARAGLSREDANWGALAGWLTSLAAVERVGAVRV